MSVTLLNLKRKKHIHLISDNIEVGISNDRNVILITQKIYIIYPKQDV